MRTVGELPQIPWLGRLSPAELSDAHCARLVHALAGPRLPPAREARPPSRAAAILGLALLAISTLLLHESAPGGSLRALGGSAGDARASASSGVPEMNRMRSLMAGVLGAGAATMGAGAQDAVEWRVADGGNGHWYALYRQPTPLGWHAAFSFAQEAGAHLCALTSAAEDAWVRSHVVAPGGIPLLQSGPWIGATCEGSSWGAWRWTTGEPWSYTAWAGSEPNNGGGQEFYVQMYQGGNLDWNDNQEDGRGTEFSAVFEWSADCNNDGIVDYGQIRAGELVDTNANNVPDCCEQGTTCFLANGLVAHWTLDATPNDASGNGHHGLAFNLTPTADRFGVANAAYHFNGINGYMTAAGVPIPTNNSFSWSLWIKAEEPSVRGPIIERAQALGINLTSPMLFTEPTAALSFGSCCANNGSSIQTPTGSLPANRWVHFVATSAQDGRRTLYLDGQPVAETSGTAYGQELELFIFGRDRMDDPLIDNIYFPGALDDIRIYNRELSAAEVLALSRWPIADSDGDGVYDNTDNCVNIANPSQSDCDSDGIGDACARTTCAPIGQEWTGSSGGNGHWYALGGPFMGTWTAAKSYAESLGGHLVTITSASEQQFAATLAFGSTPLSEDNCWLGGYQDRSASDYSEPSGGWRWVTGEPWDFTSWRADQPTNITGTNDYLVATTAPSDQLGWVDSRLAHEPGNCQAFIEWSADCNGDGVVDYGQLRSGQLADTNHNYIPDTCEAITVPTDFATVQAAIDSVPAGTHRVIRLLPGTYNHAFSLNGKDLIIRGAADGSTVLDGTGLPSSIATFTGGEPATAGLESLVFRNGTVGSLIYDGALFKVGGAVYGRDSSAFIRNCRFEGNRSDYGGGAYLLYCNMLVEDCVFTANTGVAQGGGLMVFGTTGAVRNCTFTGNQCGIAGVGGGSAFKAAGALFTGETVVFDGCTVTGNTAGVEGGAVEYYENIELHPGTLRIASSTITGNRSGTGTLAGAGGVMITGRMQSTVIGAGTTVCDNLPRNIEGAFLIESAPVVCDCLADVSGDGVVNGGDLGLLLSAWGPSNAAGTGDVNHDGSVDGADLAIMLSSWGPCQ